MSTIIHSYFKTVIGRQQLESIVVISALVGVISFAIVLLLGMTAIFISIAIMSFSFLGIYLFIRWEASIYCYFCRKRVYPKFKSHICEIDNGNMHLRLNGLISNQLKPHFDSIQQIVDNLSNLGIFVQKYELYVFRENMISLRTLELIGNYKYAIIGMGSILEFMVARYCKVKKINPTNKSTFFSYLQIAIDRNLFGQKNSWLTIQHNLRNFRNYIHIEKEMAEEPIDRGWYITTKSVFERILSNFQ